MNVISPYGRPALIPLVPSVDDSEKEFTSTHSVDEALIQSWSPLGIYYITGPATQAMLYTVQNRPCCTECYTGHVVYSATQAMLYTVHHRPCCTQCNTGHVVQSATQVMLYRVLHRPCCTQCNTGHVVQIATQAVLYTMQHRPCCTYSTIVPSWW